MAFAAHYPQALLEVRQTIATLDCIPIETTTVVGDNNVQAIAQLRDLEIHFCCRRMADDIVQGFLYREEEAVPLRFSERNHATLHSDPQAANDRRRRKKLLGKAAEVIGERLQRVALGINRPNNDIQTGNERAGFLGDSVE